jgi:glycosyltransferase involved in cell wall biosynthesis
MSPSNGDPAASSRVVVFVMDTLGLSGRTKGFVDLVLHLDPARYRPVVCTLEPETSILADALAARSVPVEVSEVRPGLRPGAVLRLAGALRRHRAAVVHAVNPRPMLVAGLAARLLGIRRTVGSLSAFASQVPDREYRFLPLELVNRGRRQAIRNQVACRLMRRMVALSPALGDRFCRFTAAAPAPFRLLGEAALRDRMHSIGYGIDLEVYRSADPAAVAALRTQAGAGPDTVLLGSVGRLVEQKDYPTQLAAFARAAREEPRLRMVLAGDGPLRGAIEAQLAQLGIADRVVLLGNWTRVPELLRAVDVFVLASKFEPYGVSLLEAKCAGAAIVSTSVNEIPTLVDDGRTGLLVPPESPGAMAAAFVRIARDAELRRALGQNALADAHRRHGIEAVAGAYQALYDEPQP